MTGFEKFSEQCMYRRITYGEVIGDCSYLPHEEISYCTHANNTGELDGELCAYKCKLYRCPFYDKKVKDDDYANEVNRILSLCSYLEEHPDMEKELKDVYEHLVEKHKISKIKLNEDAINEWYKREWNLLTFKGETDYNE